MTVTNQTSVTLTILGKNLWPGKSEDYPVVGTTNLHIHSQIGSCIITTEYGQRSFMNFGKLVAEEGCEKDNNGKKTILVSAID